MDHARRFCWIIHRDHRVVITAVLLGKGGGSDVSGEWSDVPGTDAEEILHGKSLGGIFGLARYR